MTSSSRLCGSRTPKVSVCFVVEMQQSKVHSKSDRCMFAELITFVIVDPKAMLQSSLQILVGCFDLMVALQSNWLCRPPSKIFRQLQSWMIHKIYLTLGTSHDGYKMCMRLCVKSQLQFFCSCDSRFEDPALICLCTLACWLEAQKLATRSCRTCIMSIRCDEVCSIRLTSAYIN